MAKKRSRKTKKKTQHKKCPHCGKRHKFHNRCK